MKTKRFLSVIIALAMVISCMGLTALAADTVAKIGNVEYKTIDEAITAWTPGTTLTLLADVTLSDVITLKSTEHHILNLSTYTMTAASGKNAIVIQACGTGSAERSAITINADATNPGGINAGKNSVIYYKYADGGISTEDRPIIKINGGVFTGSTSSWGTAGIYTIGTGARKCATLNISGGTFNCSINGSGKSKLIISGGTFNYSVGSQGDSTASRLISGGTFKTIGFMTADDNNTKFWIGTSMGNSNVGVYVDDNGYIVVGGTPVTEVKDTFEASSANYSGASSYLKYSSAKDNGLYYTRVEEALADNNKATGSVTVYVDELDMSDITYKGTIVVPEGQEIVIIVEEGATPAWTLSADADSVIYTDSEGKELEINSDGSFVPKKATVEGVSVVGVEANVYHNEGTPDSYNITLADGEEWTDDTSAVVTLPAVEGAVDGDMAYVMHEHDGNNYFYVGKVDNGSITFTNNIGFSTFTVNAGGLQDALNAAASGDTVTMITTANLESPLTIAKDKNVILDLNGKTITYDSTVQGEAMITNKGTLTINDSAGNGVINYNYTGAADSTYGKGNYTISNAGTLTVNGGKITIADLRAHAKYPIDNNSTTGDAILIINGGHLYNYNTSAIRQFCNSTTYKNSVTINGGLIEGYSAIWVQNPGSNTVNGSLSITGGEVRTTAAAYVNGSAEIKDVASKIYCTIDGDGGKWSNDSAVSITGGTINENVYLEEAAPTAITVNESGATFNGYVKTPVLDNVAKIGETGYATLQAAVDAAAEGQTITMISTANLASPLVIAKGKNVTIDLNGKNINYSSDVQGEAMISNSGTLTINDETNEGAIVFTYIGVADTNYGKGNYTVDNRGSMTLNGGTIEIKAKDCEGKFPHALYAIQNYSGFDLTINDGRVYNANNIAVRTFGDGDLTVTDGEIEGLRAIWIQLPSNNPDVAPEVNVNISGGTLTGTGIGESNNNKLAIYSYSYGNDMKNVTIDISGGTFNGDIALTGGSNKTNIETVNVTGGTFNGKFGELYSYGDDAKAAEAITITGGTFSTNYAEMYATNDGFVFEANADGTYGVDANWVTNTDAGAYDDGSVGMMRFLFAIEAKGEVTASGIKYIKSSDIGADVESNIAASTESGDANAFYGDIIGITNGQTGNYFAVAYATIGGKTYWSTPLGCSPDFTKVFTNYTPEVND